MASVGALQSLYSPSLAGTSSHVLVCDALLNSQKGADLVLSCAEATEPNLQMFQFMSLFGGSIVLSSSKVGILREATSWL